MNLISRLSFQAPHRCWEQLKMLVELFECPVIWTQRTRPRPLDILSVWSPGAQEKKENFVLKTSTFLAEFCLESSVLSEFPLGQDSQQRQIYLRNGLNIIIWARLPTSIMSLGKIVQVCSFGVLLFSILFTILFWLLSGTSVQWPKISGSQNARCESLMQQSCVPLDTSHHPD